MLSMLNPAADLAEEEDCEKLTAVANNSEASERHRVRMRSFSLTRKHSGRSPEILSPTLRHDQEARNLIRCPCQGGRIRPPLRDVTSLARFPPFDSLAFWRRLPRSSFRVILLHVIDRRLQHFLTPLPHRCFERAPAKRRPAGRDLHLSLRANGRNHESGIQFGGVVAVRSGF